MNGDLLIALGVVIVTLGGALYMAALANKRTAQAATSAAGAAQKASDALSKQTETNIQLNNELQEVIRERREWEKERRSWEKERQRLEDDQEDLRKTITLLTAEQARLQAALKAERDARQLAEQGRDVEIGRLNESIEGLKRDVRDRDQKIALLSSQLAESETARLELSGEVKKLRALMNGKVDKPAAEPAETTSDPEPAEVQPESSEMSLKPTEGKELS
jgi:chromosome segregation ATPase